jgi:hypothetical protein
MNGNDWIKLLIVAVIAYFIGVKFPMTGQTILGKVGA